MSIDFIEMINDGIAIDQCFATIKHQRRDAAKWVAGPHLSAVVEAGERTLFKRHTINIESDRNASRKWRAIYPDQQHSNSNVCRFLGSQLTGPRVNESTPQLVTQSRLPP